MHNLRIILVVLGLAVLGCFAYLYWESKKARPVFLYHHWFGDKPIIRPIVFGKKFAKKVAEPDVVIFKKVRGRNRYFVQNTNGKVLFSKIDNLEEMKWGFRYWKPKGYELALFQPVPDKKDRFKIPDDKLELPNAVEIHILWGEESRKEAQK